MKLYTLFIAFILHSVCLIGQEEQELSVLKTDSTWIKEIISFPIGFAQEIKFEGFEDLRFPKGWSKIDQPQFWSYAWAWSINDRDVLTESELEENIQYYFDGLFGLNFDGEGKEKRQKTNALFVTTKVLAGFSQYVGKVKTFDSRYSNKTMTLNVMADQYFCKEQNKVIIFFRFSPKELDDELWKIFDQIQLRSNYCDE